MLLKAHNEYTWMYFIPRVQHQDLYLLYGSLLETYNVTIASAYWRAALSSQVRGSGVKNPFWKNPRWPPCLGLTRRALSCVSNKIVYKMKKNCHPQRNPDIWYVYKAQPQKCIQKQIYSLSKIYHKWICNLIHRASHRFRVLLCLVGSCLNLSLAVSWTE